MYTYAQRTFFDGFVYIKKQKQILVKVYTRKFFCNGNILRF